MAGTEPIIELRAVSKDYPVLPSLGQWLRQPWVRPARFRALENVSFRLQRGQIVAVVGLNGAGKTTLLKILCNLLAPTTGSVRVAGFALPRQSRDARARIGFVPSDERSFFWRISARANLEFFAALYHVPPRQAARRIDELLDHFGLAGRSGGHFRDYSSGMRKRLSIIRGLVHEPSVLVLDEPTNSLDVKWDAFLRDYVRQWVKRQPDRVVVWSTHRLEEVRESCDSVLCLEAGRLVAPEGLVCRESDRLNVCSGEPVTGASCIRAGEG